MNKNKLAQQEILGFVLIILVVTIVSIIFITIIALKPEKQITSIEINKLLESSGQATTNCKISDYSEYKTINDLIKDSYKNPSKVCYNGEKVSKELEKELKIIIDKSLFVNPNAVNKAYNLTIYYENKNSKNPPIPVLKFGKGVFKNCTSIITGKNAIPKDLGNIYSELRVCKNI